MNQLTTLDLARFYHQHRLACYPFETGTKENKPPEMGVLTWGKYAEVSQTSKEIDLMFGRSEPKNIAILGGKASDNLAILDADSRQEFEAAEAYFAGLGIETWTIQRNYWTADDPHANGGAFLLRTPVPVAISDANGFGQIRGQGAYSLVPPSKHPGGSTYQFTRQPPRIFRIKSLADLPEFGLKPAQSDQAHKIPNKAWRILQGDQSIIKTYDTRSEAAAAAVASLIRGGLNLDMIHTLFCRYPGTGKFSQMWDDDPAKAARWLDRTYQKAMKWMAALDDKALNLAVAAEKWAISKSWPGKTGPSDRAVYLAHVGIVRQSGRLVYHASSRDLAYKVGISRPTATNANDRLVSSGLIKLEAKAIGTLAHCWSLVETVEVLKVYHSIVQDVMEWSTLGTNDVSHDVWRWGALGKPGYEVYSTLAAMGKATSKELATATGRGLRTVQSKLALMGEVFMVRCIDVGRGQYEALDACLDTVAKHPKIATAGKGEAQREKHLRERRQHKLQLQMGKPK